ncbi:ATP-binding protein [Streptomyces sp. NPDC053493]|uniref:ATP-binding protein n=1 Tax=Streptomyces sp. NPDC053493 TaxID=3365705 RepID=UPI0037D83404
MRSATNATPQPVQQTFPGAPESARAARAFARAVVGDRAPNLTPDELHSVQLVVSELVTNAIRYGTEPGDSLRVVLDARPDTLRVEVHDPNRRRPRAKPESTDRKRGRGLYVLDERVAEWGVDDRPLGKTVWAVFRW